MSRSTSGHEDGVHAPPGVAPRRRLPHAHWELVVCGTRGHALVGLDAGDVRPEDAVVVREAAAGERWHRCLRCDAWLPVPPPEHPPRRFPPDPDEIEVPARGKALRDRVVLRLIALDRLSHFVVLGLLAVAVFAFASHRDALRQSFYRIATDLQRGIGGGPIQNEHTGIVRELDRVFSLSGGRLHLVGAALAAYALLEGVEAVGLWLVRRWAEYLTFVATIVFIPLEVWELAHKLSWFKLLAFVVNVAIAVYLLHSKRLFGLRGGGTVEERERERDSGWAALVRTTPARWPSSASVATVPVPRKGGGPILSDSISGSGGTSR